MDAEYFRRNDGRDGETVEDVDERLPGLDVTPSLALIVKSVD